MDATFFGGVRPQKIFVPACPTEMVGGLAGWHQRDIENRSGAMENSIENKSTNNLSYDWKGELVSLLIGAIISAIMVLAWIYRTSV